MGMSAILVLWPGPFEQSFIPSSNGGSTVSKEKKFESIEYEWPWTKVN